MHFPGLLVGTGRGHSVPPASSVVPSRGLHGSIMVSVMTAAESARDVLAAVTQPVSYNELAAHLARDYSMELFDSLSGLVRCHAEELSGPALCNVLWAYTTVGHRDVGLANTIMQSLLGKLPDLGSADLANMLWALSRLGIYDPQFVLSALERVWDALPTATPRQLAAILQAYAWFRQHDPELEEDEDLLRSIAAKLRAQVPEASPADLALALSGMARLRRADGALLAEACGALQRVAPNMALPVLAEAVWACALLQFREVGFLEAVASRVVEAVQLATALMPMPPALALGVRSTLPLPLRPRAHERPAAAPAAADTAGSSATPARGPPAGQAPLPAPLQGQEAARGGGSVGSAASKRAAGKSPNPAQELGLAMDGPVSFSSLWPTHLGPGGHSNPCVLTERFNPALPDEWQPLERGASTAAASEGGVAASPAAAFPNAAVEADVVALQDGDVLSKLLWSYGALHCYSMPLYTLLFRQLPHLRFDRTSWSALARLLGAQLKAYELQPGGSSASYKLIKPLEAESATAWGRLIRAREPAHKLPAYLLPAAFVAFQAESDGRDLVGTHGGAAQQQQPAPHMPGTPPSRLALEAEVVGVLRSMGLTLRPSSTVDGMFHMEYTIPVNGFSICVEVLSAGCCVLEPPYWPMGPAVTRLRSLIFRGWTPLVVPFHEWAALSAEEGSGGRTPKSEPGGGELLRKREAAVAAQQRYLRRKLEELIGEELPPVPQLAPKRRPS